MPKTARNWHAIFPPWPIMVAASSYSVSTSTRSRRTILIHSGRIAQSSACARSSKPISIRRYAAKSLRLCQRSARCTSQRLQTWHRAARAAFQALVPRSPVADRLARCHYVLSYGFEMVRPEMLEHAQLPERLRRTVFDVQAQFRSGWNMFDPPYRRGVQARFVLDPASGDDEVDFLEAAWLRARNPDATADFWRVSPSGYATVIRPYPEDQGHLAVSPAAIPGTYLSPFRRGPRSWRTRLSCPSVCSAVQRGSTGSVPVRVVGPNRPRVVRPRPTLATSRTGTE